MKSVIIVAEAKPIPTTISMSTITIMMLVVSQVTPEDCRLRVLTMDIR